MHGYALLNTRKNALEDAIDRLETGFLFASEGICRLNAERTIHVSESA